ncbi:MULTISPECIES: flagellar motor switch protein FliM [unclassified Sphingomonas]|uniref:flagellar motor switch protein FliM n=1 Tax=unclassified Sphingomonas TaxID=196159 RepID=UPI0006F77F3D|nr:MULTISPECIES: flagellar motor switch protein FliM [unclassified Sphingomonas]KQM96764.1 flagellar motor switch protein FliM [Sphingomonas sp. Leaf25]KQN39543.1 flagellar motor switch protein FliM [Sphingomonas sp. Leaf42]KQT28820.1 flagellar motor switch protein FliM [Sphingomonas sp. Leaf407]
MVNTPATPAPADRREKARRTATATHVATLGATNLNPFGDLHAFEHLSTRMARSMRQVFEPLLRRAVRSWAEPVEVDRFAGFCAGRKGTGLTAWVPLTLSSGGSPAILVIDGAFLLETLDLFFGGFGDVPNPLPSEFSPAAEAMLRRLARAIAQPLSEAWGPLAGIAFEAGNPEANPAMLSAIDGEDAVVATRFGIAAHEGRPTFIDILYPVAALKPHAPQLTTKVHGKTATPDPRWRSGLTRAVMTVKLPVRSVLAEPVVSLGVLLELKEGDVIPISFGPEVPVWVANQRLGTGTVGTANGQAAIKLISIDPGFEEDFQ